MNDQWLTPRWETASTCYKDCDSTMGVWNDPPQLATPAGFGVTLSIGRGKIHLLDDASIAGVRPSFEQWRGKRVACLMDEPGEGDFGAGDGAPSFSVAGLILRYLFQAGIPCCRIHPSEHSGFVDENRLFYWPVATSNLDVIIWIPIREGLVTTRMKSLTCRFPLLKFVENGGALYLGGGAQFCVAGGCADFAGRRRWLAGTVGAPPREHPLQAAECRRCSLWSGGAPAGDRHDPEQYLASPRRA
ncbi:MAG: hypothetical protein HY360_10725 [Verrucomicrobia bacterium]|nr:hypothetical protein [Verrucomicrobiota bacterium]